jgi:hypothetical protein
MTAWFAEYDLSGASPDQLDVVNRIVGLLDELAPARLDRGAQSVNYDAEGDQTWATLQHNSDPVLEIRIVVSDGWANFYGVIGHDEAYSDDAVDKSPDGWKKEALDILADLLIADYTVCTFTLAGRFWRDEVSIGEPVNRRFVEGSPLSLFCRCGECREKRAGEIHHLNVGAHGLAELLPRLGRVGVGPRVWRRLFTPAAAAIQTWCSLRLPNRNSIPVPADSSITGSMLLKSPEARERLPGLLELRRGAKPGHPRSRPHAHGRSVIQPRNGTLHEFRSGTRW